MARIGKRTLGLIADANDLAWLLAWFTAAALNPRRWPRAVRRVLLWQVYFTGVQATPLIAVLSVLVGVIVVMQAQLFLRNVGQTTLLAPLLVAVLFRELAPLLVNLLLIGRSGNAVTVELATMSVTGELRVLEAQGIDLFGYLVVPRVAAMVVSAACLTSMFVVFSVAAGYIAGQLLGTNPGPPMQFHDDLMRYIEVGDLLAIAVKTLVPAALIGCICCAEGLATRGSITAVPPAAIRAMTRCATVTFAIIVLVSVLRYL